MGENNCLNFFLLVFVAYVHRKSKQMVIFLKKALKVFESKSSLLQILGVPYSIEKTIS